MFNWILKLFSREEEFFPGVLKEKTLGNNAHTFEEGVGVSATAGFPVKKESEIRQFPYQYQYKSSACVAYTMAKIACVLYFLKTNRKVKFSPGFFYPRRINKPGLGMFFSDITTLANEGSCLYELLPCEGMDEAQINAIKIEDYHKESADAFALPKDWIETPDFDTVAATIEKTGKPVMLWFTFGPGEFFGTTKPKMLGNDRRWDHSVCAVDAFTDVKDGKQYIRIEDSADKEQYYQKNIDRAFFTRAWLKYYPRNFVFTKETSVPIYAGTVKSMQAILQALGFFPNDPSLLTGYFGSITENAVRDFCKVYAITFVPGRKVWLELEKKLYSLNK
jgi:hypothetical protein